MAHLTTVRLLLIHYTGHTFLILAYKNFATTAATTTNTTTTTNNNNSGV
jgi:hypothetical protein